MHTITKIIGLISQPKPYLSLHYLLPARCFHAPIVRTVSQRVSVGLLIHPGHGYPKLQLREPLDLVKAHEDSEKLRRGETILVSLHQVQWLPELKLWFLSGKLSSTKFGICSRLYWLFPARMSLISPCIIYYNHHFNMVSVMTAAPRLLLLYFLCLFMLLSVCLWFISGIRFVQVRAFLVVTVSFISTIFHFSCRPKYGRHIYATFFFTWELMCTNVSPRPPVRSNRAWNSTSRSGNNQAAQLKKSMSINVFICSKLIELKGSSLGEHCVISLYETRV